MIMKNSLRFFMASACLAALAVQCLGETTAERDTRMKWWREARFGLFVHWGLYSGAAGEWDGRKYGGGVEWIQHYAGVPTAEYGRRMIPRFKPNPDFARQWAALAKEAGMKYLVFTSKHHEGFALHNSAVTDFDAYDVTGRDLVKEISEAVRAQGLKLGYYHSVIDWHHPDFPVRGTGLPHPLQKAEGDHDQGRVLKRYQDYLHAQALELVSHYGQVDVLWWDYSKPQAEGETWRANELMAMVRKHQPNIIMNNRLYNTPDLEKDPIRRLKNFDTSKGDFTTPEQSIPSTGIPGVDWETCMTMNNTWGYSAHDNNWKPVSTLIRNLVDIASKGGNYLLNVGPKVDGSVPEESVQRLKEIGAWMRKNGESIYATSANPIGAVEWGRITVKGDQLFLHFFKAPTSGVVTVPAQAGRQYAARFLAEKSAAALPVKIANGQVEIEVGTELPDAIDTVVVLTAK